jgi:hypothetical protein
MKGLKRIGLTIILTTAVALTLSAQFSLSGEFRPRAEFSHGYKSLAGDAQHPSLFTSQRTRLNLDFSKDKLKTGLSLQDVRIWGNQAQLVGNEANATSIHQAWLEYSITPAISFKAGRQELVYDNSRILGNVGWAQQARSHDLVLFKYDGSISVHAGVAYHENSDRTNNFYLGPDAYKTMQFLWANHKFEKLHVSVIFLNNGIPIVRNLSPVGDLVDQGISFSQTVGPVIKYNTEKVGISLETYYQGGKDGSETSVSAFYGNVQGSVKLGKVALFAGYEYLSGTDFNEAGTNHSFTPFYGTNHKFNGYMDYFYVGNHVNNVGLQDIYLKAKTGIKRFALSADIHMFNSAADIAAATSSYLGTELDLVCAWKVDKQISISAGYSHMIASSSMELIKGGSSDAYQNWAWLMLTVKPTFFKSGE